MKLSGALFFLALGLPASSADLAAQLAAQMPPPRFEQRLGAALPLETRLRDETGRSVALGNYFGRRPVVLIFGYYKCPQLCSVLERSVVDLLRNLRATVGRDFDVVYVSIDPTDAPADAYIERTTSARAYGRGEGTGGWHYLTGPADATKAVADAAGFAFRYDPGSRQYAHPSGFIVATPRGVLSRYFPGLDFPPEDVASAIRRAAQGKTGEPVYNLVLECFRGGGVTGGPARAAWRALEVAVGATVLGLFGAIGWMLREERRALRAGKGLP